MKTLRPSKGPFTEQPYFTQEDIETLCLEELARVNLLPSNPAPIRIDRFIEKRFGKPHSYANLESGVLGLTRFGANGVQEIVISKALEEDKSRPAERRLRTTLAHEAGHGLLHAHLFVLDSTRPLFGDWTDAKRPRVLCREPSHLGYGGEWWEFQANMVMGVMLMPRLLVTEAVQNFLEPTGSLGLAKLAKRRRQEAARELAEVFDVNPVAVGFRLAGLFPDAVGGQLAL
jgi:hypothetical protein